jgi:hypothetical protein
MLRTVLTIGLFAVLALFALNLLYGVLPLLMGLLWSVISIAFKVGLFILVIYLLIRILSPDTARRMRERWSGM